MSPRRNGTPSRSGSSGRHSAPRYLLTFESEYQRDAWKAMAKRRKMTFAQWIRDACMAEYERQA